MKTLQKGIRNKFIRVPFFMKTRIHIPLVLAVLTLISCDKGKILDNHPPETNLFVTSIQLQGDYRLSSRVELHWDGSDEDGYVKGYEFSFDQSVWNFTAAADSTFIFTIPPGTDTLDYDFWIRAVDNLGLRDPSPDYIRIPVKNTPPVMSFDSVFAMPDTVHFVIAMKWIADDADGYENIDSLYIQLNQGDWFPIRPGTDFAICVAADPAATGSGFGNLHTGIPAAPQPGQINELICNGDNFVILRAKDVSGAYSIPDTSKIFFVKNKTADLLVIDSYKSGGTDPESVYSPILASIPGGYDYINIERNNGEMLPQPVNPALGFVLNEYEKVFWYSDASARDDGIAETNDLMYIETAAQAIQDYLNNGGKFLMTARLPLSFENTSSVFDYSPMDSVSTAPGQARIVQGQLQMPFGAFSPSFDTLESNTFITGAQPFYPKDSSHIMFTSQLTPVLGWTGPDIIAARTTNAGNTNFVFMSVALHELNARPGTVSTFILNVLNNEFAW